MIRARSSRPVQCAFIIIGRSSKGLGTAISGVCTRDTSFPSRKFSIEDQGRLILDPEAGQVLLLWESLKAPRWIRYDSLSTL